MSNPILKLLAHIGYVYEQNESIFYFRADRNRIRFFLERYKNPWLEDLHYLCRERVDVSFDKADKGNGDLNFVINVFSNSEKTDYRKLHDTNGPTPFVHQDIVRVYLQDFKVDPEIVNHVYVSKIEFMNFDYVSSDERVREINPWDSCLFSNKTDALVFFFTYLLPRPFFPKILFKIFNRSLCVNQSAVAYDTVISCIQTKDIYCRTIHEGSYNPREKIVGFHAYVDGVHVVRSQCMIKKVSYKSEKEREVSTDAKLPRAYYGVSNELNTLVRIFGENKTYDLVITDTVHLLLPYGYKLAPKNGGYEIVNSLLV